MPEFHEMLISPPCCRDVLVTKLRGAYVPGCAHWGEELPLFVSLEPSGRDSIGT